MNRVLARGAWSWLSLSMVLGAGQARAHEVMGSVIYVDIGHARVHLDVEIPMDELRLALGEPSRPGIAELPREMAALAAYVAQHLALESGTGAPYTLSVHARDVVRHDERNWLTLAVDATPPAHESPRDFVLTTDVIDHRVVSHRVFVFLRNDVEGGLLGKPSYLDTLHYQRHEVHVAARGGSVWRGLCAVFQLGMAHIAEGSDHLLFLFTLLLPAGLGVSTARRWAGRRGRRDTARAVARIVTAFTLGHSATLALGALGLAHLPTSLVESLIAASVLVSAAHVLVPIFPRREAWVALGFGLVHGLGFASALAGLGVDAGSLALTVLGFNAGVEAMQALLVLATLPWLYVLAGTRLGTPLRSAGGAASFALALAWLVERAFGVATPLLPLAEAAFQRGPWLIACLAASATLAWLATRKNAARAARHA